MSEDSLLFQNARILDPSSGTDRMGDLLVEKGKIAAIENPGIIPEQRAQQKFNAKGLWLTPGLIDMHVHLREPGLEYKETLASGTQAAVAGGFTSVACMANTLPVNDTAHVTAFIRERAKQTGACRVFPIGAVSRGLKGETLAEIGSMVQEGAVAISDDGMPVMNSYLMRKAMDYAKAFDIPVISHAEDTYLVGLGVINEGALSNELGLRGNPSASEEIMVAREIALCRLTRARVHIAHLTTQLGIECVKRAKEQGLPITAEVSPHHLTLTQEALKTYDTCCKVNPPLRTEEDRQALLEALEQGIIDTIATDHAPHGLIDKNVEFDRAASGMIGLQTVVPLTLRFVREGKLSLNRWLSALTEKPAQILKLEVGTLRIGQAADLTVIDPEQEWVLKPNQILSKSQNTPFMNEPLKGKVKWTIVAGRLKHEA